MSDGNMKHRIEYLQRIVTEGRNILVNSIGIDIMLSNADSLRRSLVDIKFNIKHYTANVNQLLDDLSDMGAAEDAKAIYADTRHLIEIQVPSMIRRIESRLEMIENRSRSPRNGFAHRSIGGAHIQEDNGGEHNIV